MRVFPVLMLARICLMILVGGVSVVAGATREAAVSGMMVPFFDDAGRLTHRLYADRGASSGGLQRLQGVRIDFYTAADPKRVEQRVTTDEAVWDPKKETLTGSGRIAVETERTQLAGEGFAFVLATGRIDIHRQFSMTHPDSLLTSDRAEVDLVLQRDGDDVRLRDVKRVEAFGNLRVMIPPAVRKQVLGVEELFSERAIYDGATHTIHLPEKVRGKKSGGAAEFNGFRYELDAASRPANRLK
jgi:hypothetical protein